MTELEASGVEEQPPPYIIFVVVFLFFLTGLLGFLICHLLKKKGYRCRTGDMDDAEEEEEKLGGNADDEDEENQDTVEQILKCIIENEANMEAFNEMLGNHNVCVRHDPRLRKESIGGIPSHHHTVHSGSDHNSCHLCAQVRSKKGRRQSRTPRSKHRPGEQTVFSVGRFRVTHHDKKHHGGPNPMVSSGDQLDQSQDSEERKEGYNLRSMFKDARPPSESSNGVAQNVGKRRKSVTIFGLRRGSDPVGIKVGEGTARETGGVRFAIQKQPVVVEELLQKENPKVTPEHGTKPGIIPETEPSKNQICAPAHHEDKTIGVVNPPSSQTNVKAHDSSPAPEIGSKHGPSLEPCTNLMIKPTTGRTAAFGGSALPISSPASSRQIFKTMEKGKDIEDNMLKIDAYDPGPLQTSTPIAPMYGLISSFTPVIPADQPEPYSSTGFPITQTPPNPSPGADLEPDFGASLALISLGSSPPSSFQIKTASSVSLLGTPTSPLAVTPSPNLSSRNTPSEATKSDFSPALTPSPKLPSGKAMSRQSPTTYSRASQLKVRAPSPAPVASPKPDTMPVSPQTSSPADQNLAIESPHCLTLKSESVTSITSMTKGDIISSQLSLKEQELEGATIPKSEGKTERKTVGILETLKISSPADRLSKDRLSTLPLSPSSLTSPSSPIGNRLSNVTIVKASPDSKREFSVAIMVEEEESSTSLREQKGETSELGVESDKVRISSADSQGVKLSASGVGPSESQRGETSGAEDRPMIYQEKDDMVEMEDIRDCQVQQVEGADKVNEE